jgi:hypothetical protein
MSLVYQDLNGLGMHLVNVRTEQAVTGQSIIYSAFDLIISTIEPQGQGYKRRPKQ